MQTIRETGLNTPEGTYKMPTYKEAGMRNFMNLVRTMVNDYGVFLIAKQRMATKG